MRRLCLASALSLVTAFLLAGCLSAKLAETQDVVSSVPWTGPEAPQYVLIDKDKNKEMGRGTLEISNKDGQFELSQKFQNGDDYDNSAVLVDATTLKPISGTRDQFLDGKRRQHRSSYDPVENVVTVTEIKENDDERPVPHRLKSNYYDNDESLFLWRTINFVEGYTASYRTFVTGSGEQHVIRLEVKGKEQVTIGAGTFDTWRLEIRGTDRKQTAWYADTPQRPLIKYDNDFGQLMELTSLGQ